MTFVDASGANEAMSAFQPGPQGSRPLSPFGLEDVLSLVLKGRDPMPSDSLVFRLERSGAFAASAQAGRGREEPTI